MSPEAWSPSRILHHEKTLRSSTCVARVGTDAGRAFLKVPDNPEGQHALASDWVGISLARWLGLPTFDFALLPLDSKTISIPRDPDEEKPIELRSPSAGGTCLATRAVRGQPWSGDLAEMASEEDRATFAGLVVLDTWLLNEDRYPCRPKLHFRTKPNLDNVFLEERIDATGATPRLLAMDFSEALRRKECRLRSSYGIELVRDTGIFGLFPELQGCVTTAHCSPFLERLRSLARSTEPSILSEIVMGIPRDWDFPHDHRLALVDFLRQRAAYLADSFLENLRLALLAPSSPS